MSNTATANLNWYAMRVRFNNEMKISQIFREKFGLNAWVPLHKVWTRKSGRRSIKKTPLLNSYVLLHADIYKLNKNILFSPGGVFGFLSMCGAPAPIPNDQIAAIEKLEKSEKPVLETDISNLKEHDKVEVIDGPLKGAIGIFQKINAKTGNFILSLDLFKRTLKTELEADLIKPF